LPQFRQIRHEVAGGDGADARTLMSRSRLFRQSYIGFDELRDAAIQVFALLIKQTDDLGDHGARLLVLRDLLRVFSIASICVTWRRRVTRSSRRVRFSGLFSHQSSVAKLRERASVAASILSVLASFQAPGKVTRLTRIDHSDVEGPHR